MSMRIERRHLYGTSNLKSLLPEPNAPHSRLFLSSTASTKKTYPLRHNSLLKDAPPQATSSKPGPEARISEFKAFVGKSAAYSATNKDIARLTLLNSLKSAEGSSVLGAQIDRKPSNSLASKIYINKHADIESQQISNLHNKNKTEEASFNLRKIFDFRALLKRRYYFSKDFNQIFHAWTGSSRERIELCDLERMSKKIGVPLNAKEAEILFALANRSASKSLDCRGFADLVFNDGFFAFVQKEKIEAQRLSGPELISFISAKAGDFQQVELLAKAREILARPEKGKEGEFFGREEFLRMMGSARNELFGEDSKTKEAEAQAWLAFFDRLKNDKGVLSVKEICDRCQSAEEKMKAISKQENSEQSKRILEFFLGKNKREIPFSKLESNFKRIVAVR